MWKPIDYEGKGEVSIVWRGAMRINVCSLMQKLDLQLEVLVFQEADALMVICIDISTAPRVHEALCILAQDARG